MVIEHLKEAQKWLAKAQHGDPNGAKAYQASKFVGYALQELEAAQQYVQSDGAVCTYHGCKNPSVINGYCNDHRHVYYATDDDA